MHDQALNYLLKMQTYKFLAIPASSCIFFFLWGSD